MSLDEMIIRGIAIIALMLAISAWERGKRHERQFDNYRRASEEYRRRIERLELRAGNDASSVP